MTEPSASDTVFTFPRTKPSLFIGRDTSCDIVLKGIGVSRIHATIFCKDADVWIEDCSTLGTRVNGMPVQKAHLDMHAIVTIGINKLAVAYDLSTLTVTVVHDLEIGRAPLAVEQTADITIGRDPSNTICLSHPLISRFHATVRRDKNQAYILDDHGSTNATFVNGVPCRTQKLADGDIIQVGPYRLYLDNGSLKQAQDFNRIKIEAYDVAVRRGKNTILNNVSILIEPGEFVAILGPSGAGKSTLANALTGQIPLFSGNVFYNGLPMRKFCSAFNSAIGFVSQQNMLRPELTVLETFTEQSLLRLPADSLPVEHRERIREVMDMLSLSLLSNRRVANLSGGEAKRVHFGIELLSSPTVIFLDEPLAGLDPGLIHKFMELFRSICDQGHTILLTTHTLEQLDLCDRIVFVSNGTLAFSGSPAQMKTAFKSETISDVYEKVKALASLQKSDSGDTNKTIKYKGDENDKSVKMYKPKTVSFVKQFVMLLHRYSTICIRDFRTLGLMLLQAPVIAFLLSIVFDTSSSFLPLSFFFCITISVIWMGGMNSVREISREWPLLEREFRIGLSNSAYIVSKLLVFSVLSSVIGLIFCACMHLLFINFAFDIKNIVLLCVACSAGSLLGLCISGISRNVNMAISFLPIIFIPQIFFSGILMPFDEMPAAGRIISYLTVSRPVFSMFKKMSFMDQSLWKMEDWQTLFFLVAGLIILLFAAIGYRRYTVGRFFK